MSRKGAKGGPSAASIVLEMRLRAPRSNRDLEITFPAGQRCVPALSISAACWVMERRVACQQFYPRSSTTLNSNQKLTAAMSALSTPAGFPENGRFFRRHSRRHHGSLKVFGGGLAGGIPGELAGRSFRRCSQVQISTSSASTSGCWARLVLASAKNTCCWSHRRSASSMGGEPRSSQKPTRVHSPGRDIAHSTATYIWHFSSKCPKYVASKLPPWQAAHLR